MRGEGLQDLPLFKGGGIFFPIVPSHVSLIAELGVCMNRGTCTGRTVADPMG